MHNGFKQPLFLHSLLAVIDTGTIEHTEAEHVCDTTLCRRPALLSYPSMPIHFFDQTFSVPIYTPLPRSFALWKRFKKYRIYIRKTNAASPSQSTQEPRNKKGHTYKYHYESCGIIITLQTQVRRFQCERREAHRETFRSYFSSRVASTVFG